MTKKEWIYLAGLFDGEGCLCISTHNRSKGKQKCWELRAQICMCDYDVLAWIHRNVGGTLRLVRLSKKNIKWRDAWQWSLKGSQVYYFCQKLLPYMKIKNRQAKVAMEFSKRLADPRIYRNSPQD